MRRQAKRQIALELTHRLTATPTSPREFPSSPFGPAMKVQDAETRRLIDAALKKRGYQDE